MNRNAGLERSLSSGSPVPSIPTAESIEPLGSSTLLSWSRSPTIRFCRRRIPCQRVDLASADTGHPFHRPTDRGDSAKLQILLRLSSSALSTFNSFSGRASSSQLDSNCRVAFAYQSVNLDDGRGVFATLGLRRLAPADSSGYQGGSSLTSRSKRPSQASRAGGISQPADDSASQPAALAS